MSLLKRIATLLMLSITAARAQTIVPATPSPLNGNWHLAGNRTLKQFPQLSISVQVNGAQVFAHGWMQLRCSGSQTKGVGGSFGLDGILASDGSFTLVTQSERNSNQLTLTGNVAGGSATTWSGTYRITNTSPTCSIDDKDAFTATPLAAFTGTFRGSAFTYPGPAKDVTFTLTTVQAAPITRTIRTGAFRFYFPITGTLQVAGSPCFTHGTAEASPYNTLEGDLSHLHFIMDDGSELQLNAVFADPTESAIDVIDASVKGGKCDQQGYIHALLNRQ